MTATSVVARPMLAGMFVFGGVESLRDPKSRVVPADKVAPAIARQLGLPEDTELLVRINGGVQVAAGLMLATGKLPRLAALVLASTLVPTTLAGHRFWEEQDPTKRHTQQVQFLKNTAMLGGLLFAAADTGGRPSVTWWASHRARRTRRASRKAMAKAAKTAGAASAAVDAAQFVTKGAGKLSKSGAELAASAVGVGAALKDRVEAYDVADVLRDVAAALHELSDELQARGREAADVLAPKAREALAVAAPRAKEALAVAAPRAKEAFAGAAPRAKEAFAGAAPRAKEALAVASPHAKEALQDARGSLQNARGALVSAAHDAKGAWGAAGRDGDGFLAGLRR